MSERRVSDGTTHWEGCEREHHACAIELLEQARAEIERLKAECDEGQCPAAQHERLAKAEADAAAMRLALENAPILVREPGEFGRTWKDDDQVGTTFGHWDSWYKRRNAALSGTAGEDIAAVYRAAKDVGKWDKGDGALQRLVARRGQGGREDRVKPTDEQVQAAREWLMANVKPAPRLTSSDRENWRGRTLSQRADAAVQLATLIASREAAVVERVLKSEQVSPEFIADVEAAVIERCATIVLDEVDGAEEERARDSMLSRIADAIRALGREI